VCVCVCGCGGNVSSSLAQRSSDALSGCWTRGAAGDEGAVPANYIHEHAVQVEEEEEEEGEAVAAVRALLRSQCRCECAAAEAAEAERMVAVSDRADEADTGEATGACPPKPHSSNSHRFGISARPNSHRTRPPLTRQMRVGHMASAGNARSSHGCFAFNTSGGCVKPRCRFNHFCSHCGVGALHPATRCPADRA
jgi:hypothetical protein